MSLSLRVNGTVTEVMEPKLVGAKEFPIAGFVLKVNDEYNPYIHFQLCGKNAEIHHRLSAGMGVDVDFNIKSREWEGKWFTNVEAWRVVQTESPPDGQGPQVDPEEDEKLPF